MTSHALLPPTNQSAKFSFFFFVSILAVHDFLWWTTALLCRLVRILSDSILLRVIVFLQYVSVSKVAMSQLNAFEGLKPWSGLINDEQRQSLRLVSWTGGFGFLVITTSVNDLASLKQCLHPGTVAFSQCIRGENFETN